MTAAKTCGLMVPITMGALRKRRAKPMPARIIDDSLSFRALFRHDGPNKMLRPWRARKCENFLIPCHWHAHGPADRSWSTRHLPSPSDIFTTEANDFELESVGIEP